MIRANRVDLWTVGKSSQEGEDGYVIAKNIPHLLLASTKSACLQIRFAFQLTDQNDLRKKSNDRHVIKLNDEVVFNNDDDKLRRSQFVQSRISSYSTPPLQLHHPYTTTPPPPTFLPRLTLPVLPRLLTCPLGLLYLLLPPILLSRSLSPHQRRRAAKQGISVLEPHKLFLPLRLNNGCVLGLLVCCRSRRQLAFSEHDVHRIGELW
eukprot:756964-Hanusia_phi.AAC.2